jgi:hypothetical protein
MSTTPPQPSEEELRAAYEEEIKRIRVEHVLLDNVVTLVNLGMRRTGLTPGTEPERDPGQVRLAIESVRALLPMVEEVAPDEVTAIRQALSQLQLAYVRIGGGPFEAPGSETGVGSGPAPGPGGHGSAAGDPSGPEPAAPPPPAPPKPGEAGPAERSGRLWVPGQ